MKRWTLKKRTALCHDIMNDPEDGIQKALEMGFSQDEIVSMMDKFKKNGMDGLRLVKRLAASFFIILFLSPYALADGCFSNKEICAIRDIKDSDTETEQIPEEPPPPPIIHEHHFHHHIGHYGNHNQHHSRHCRRT